MFAIIAAHDPTKLAAALKDKYPQDYLELVPGQWLVSGGVTAQEVSDTLGITNGENGSAVVLSFQTYFGRTNPNVWEWIANKMGSKRG